MGAASEPSTTDPFARPGATNRALWTVAFTLFLDLMGFGIILPVLPYYAEHYHASAIAVTMLSTTFSLAQFVMAPVLGRLSDRVGRRPVMLISIGGSVVAGLTLGFAGALWVIFAARLIAGVSKANVSTAHAYVADLVAPAERAKHMGRMGAAIGLGFVVGPGVGGLLSIDSMPHLPFFVSAGLSAINLAMAWLWLPETRRPAPTVSTAPTAESGDSAPSGVDLRRLWVALAQMRGTPLPRILVVAFLVYVSFASMESTMALYNERLLGWGAAETGTFIAYIGVVIILTQGVLIGAAVRSLGEVKTLVIGLFALGIGLSILASMSSHLPFAVRDGGATSISALAMFGLGGLLMAAGNGLANATMSALVSRISSSERQGWNMGLKESASALARILGPAIAGPLFQWIHIGAPMWLGGLFALAGMFVAVGLGSRVARYLAVARSLE